MKKIMSKQNSDATQKKPLLQRITCACLCVAMLLGMLPVLISNSADVSAAAAPAKAGNLVVVVRFNGDTTGDGDTGYNYPYPANAGATNAPKTYWEYLQRRFNGQNDAHAQGSFKEYFQSLSGNKHDVTSYFPQTEESTGKVKYITLPKSAAEYKAQGSSGDLDIISEIVKQLKQDKPDYDASDLDMNNDGIIDNLMILASVTQQTFTPHAGTAGSVEGIGGKKINAYTLIETQPVVTNNMLNDNFDIHTAAHEYTHTFGIPDYYRSTYTANSNQNTPVGFWDTMGSPSGRPYQLAVTREKLGWTTITEKNTTTATYTLHTVDAAYKDTTVQQALKFKTPLSDSEYFVVEYRKKGQAYKFDNMDRNAPADGLIVYRVNPAFESEGNLKGNDYIYVFRPNETGLKDSAGDVSKAQIGLSAKGATRQSVGSADMSAGITQDALVYSDGKNSGIQINVTAQTDDTITFEITFPDYTSMDLWKQVTNADGSTPLTSSNAMDTQLIHSNGKLYLLAQGGSSADAFAYNGTTWESLGTAANGYASSIAVLNNEVYVLGATTRNGVVLKKLGSDKSWTDVTTISGTANTPVLAAINNKLYAWIDNGNSAQIYELNNGQLTAVGSAFTGTLSAPAIYAHDGKVHVAYADTQNHVYQAVLDGTTWTSTDLGAGGATVNSAATANHNTYLLNMGGNGTTPSIYTYTQGTTEAKKTEITTLPQNLTAGSIAADDNFVYVSVVTSANPGEAVTYYAPHNDLNNMKKLGATVYSPAGKVSSTVMNSKVYNAVTPAAMGAMDLREHDTVTPEADTVTVTWKDEDGTVLKTTQVKKGETPTYPDTMPSKPDTAQYTYTASWSPTPAPVMADQEYQIKYQETLRKYTVTWKNDDGTVLKTEQVPYGTTPSYTGETPAKTATNQTVYTFAGWSPAITTVTGDVTYKATFTEATRTYMVTWQNDDGTVLKTEQVPYGTTPSYTGNAPTKATTAEFTYTFDGWSPVLSAVSGDITYIAKYTQTKNSYTITWQNNDGTILKTETLTYGSMPSYTGTEPTKAEQEDEIYIFAGWSPTIVSVTGNATYTAVFSAQPNPNAPTPAITDLSVEKTITTLNAVAPATNFTAVLKAQNAANPMPAGSMNGLKEITVNGAGLLNFGQITFTRSGIYVYTLTEKNLGQSNFTYDETVYTITYTVTNAATQARLNTRAGGALIVTRTITVNGQQIESITLNSTYITPEPEPTLPEQTEQQPTTNGTATENVQTPQTGHDTTALLIASVSCTIAAMIAAVLLYNGNKHKQ